MRHTLLSALLAALSCAGCATLARPTVTPERGTIERIDAHGVDLAVALVITNTNAANLSVRDVTAHVIVDGRYDVGRVTLKRDVPIPAGKPTKVTVPISVKWRDVAPLVALGAADHAVPYVVDGSVTIGGAAVHFDVSYRLVGSMTHAEIVRATKRSLPALSSNDDASDGAR